MKVRRPINNLEGALTELHRLKCKVAELKQQMMDADAKFREQAEKVIAVYGQEMSAEDGSGGRYALSESYKVGYTHVKSTKVFNEQRALKTLPSDILKQCSKVQRVIDQHALAVLVEKQIISQKVFLGLFDETPNSDRFYFGVLK